MPKRFTDTEIWDEDWFLEFPIKYQLLWKYINDKCDHAGIWRPNKRKFEFGSRCKVDLNKFLTLINEEKERIFTLDNGRWFIVGFIPFQYCDRGRILNTNNRVHASVLEILKKNGVNLTLIRPLIEVKEGVKDKDKDNKGGSMRGEKLTYEKRKQPDDPWK